MKKTTILFPPDLYDQLAALARARSSTVGELVRDACWRQYFLNTREERRAQWRGLRRCLFLLGHRRKWNWSQSHQRSRSLRS